MPQACLVWAYFCGHKWKIFQKNGFKGRIIIHKLSETRRSQLFMTLLLLSAVVNKRSAKENWLSMRCARIFSSPLPCLWESRNQLFIVRLIRKKRNASLRVFESEHLIRGIIRRTPQSPRGGSSKLYCDATKILLPFSLTTTRSTKLNRLRLIDVWPQVMVRDYLSQ